MQQHQFLSTKHALAPHAGGSRCVQQLVQLPLLHLKLVAPFLPCLLCLMQTSYYEEKYYKVNEVESEMKNVLQRGGGRLQQRTSRMWQQQGNRVAAPWVLHL